MEKISDKEIGVITEKADLQKVYEALEKEGFQVEEPKISFISQQTISIDKETKTSYNKLFDLIDEYDDVQEIFDNVE